MPAPTLAEDCLRLRRRERNRWGDTPLAKAFIHPESWHELPLRVKLEQFNAAIRSRQHLDLVGLFSRFDTDADGTLTYPELQRCVRGGGTVRLLPRVPGCLTLRSGVVCDSLFIFILFLF